MTSPSRIVLALALALWVALPGIGSEGGQNAGGTGIWILPRAGSVPCGPAPTAPRETRVLAGPPSADLAMMMSNDVGEAVATFVDSLSGVPVSLSVSGSCVRIPASLLQALRQSPMPTADILIMDCDQVGYVMTVSVDPQTGAATIRVL